MTLPHLPLAASAAPSTLTTIDWVVIVLYFTLLAGITWWSTRKSQDTAADYFLAGRNLGWWVVGASIFASNIGSEHLVGLAGQGATDGVAMAHYELHAWCLLVLGWVMVPFYMRSHVYTMPEFLEKRFSATARRALTIISLVAYVLTKIAVGIFAGGIVSGTLIPEMHMNIAGVELNSFWIGSLAVVLLSGIDTGFGLAKMGGWAAFRAALPSDMFNLWKPLVPAGMEGTWAPVLEPTRMAWYFNGHFPWLGMLFCAPIVGLWYWCTDQYIVQRTLGAPSQTEARRGTIFAAFLKLLPVFIFIIPGMIAVALAKTGKVPQLAQAMLDANGQVINLNAQAAFPLLVQAVLPVGIRGIVVAGLLAALMSSLAGAFNACSTLFTVDLYGKWRPNASQHEIVRMGRIATVGMVLIAIAWIPVIQGAQGLYFYLQGMQGYLAPPIFVVFFMGVFWKRMNARGCLWALVAGFALGIFRLLVDTPVTLGISGFEQGYAAGSFLWIVNNTYFQYFSMLITGVAIAAAVIGSLTAPEPEYARLQGLTYATATVEDRAVTRASWDWREVVASALVLVCILAAYLYFRG
jgi:SSS family solute:Na+ symporter